MSVKAARIVIAGLSGDSGKTIVSLGVLAALRRRGLTVAPFKKGPDYIDPAWLGTAAGTVCRNLDTYLVSAEATVRSFSRHANDADVSVIEGNRGLFDGKDVSGTHSTAGLARLLQAPLLLVVNATKATRTIAALVKGCQVFEPELPLAGVVLNKVAGDRHRRIITEAIEASCGLPVLGAIPKLGSDADIIPGRHLGLTPPAEHLAKHRVTDRLVEIAETYLDLDRILAIAQAAPEMAIEPVAEEVAATPEVRLAYFADSVFTFYYPENLEALRRCGAELIPVSSLADSVLPDIHGLYIGGGFPETHAEQLTRNQSLMASVKSAAESYLPIYAECGGLIYLSRSLKWKDTTHPMAGVFPLDLQMHVKPVGHGYTSAVVDQATPFFPVGTELRGHEFHYSGVLSGLDDGAGCMHLQTGTGLGNHRDGLLYKNVMACYTHLHADGTPAWADAMIAAAREFAVRRSSSSGGGGSLSSFRVACRS